MKATYSLIILLFSMAQFSCIGQEKNAISDIDKMVPRIEVFDFHSTHRCMTCNNIEANTKYTLNTFFAGELASGKITLQVLNVDEKENYPIVEKFQAIGTSLYLNIVRDGKEEQVDLTQFAFKKGNDKEAFTEELKSTIEGNLKTF